MVAVNISTSIELDYDFEENVGCILKVIPNSHLASLGRINFVDKYPNSRHFDKDCLAYYYNDKGLGVIDINISNVLKERIPIYYFEFYQELASLALSEIIGHEIGHHVAISLKKGLKDREKYAKKYGESCYWNYFGSRKKIILLSYFLGEINFLDYSKEQRQDFKDARKRLVASYKKNKKENGKVQYP